MSENVLEIKNVKLKYSYYKTQRLKDVFLKRNKKEKKEHVALRGLSLKVKKGTNVGIIGSNGSGKSTLLRVLANTLIPDSGSVINRAKSVSLLSLGVGFKSDLSGYENIFLSGLLLGLSQNELKEKIDEIIDFAEIREFIFNPVRTYSSGMRSRLAFSIAINVDPELLLIDELFSVGDIRFKEKSKQKIISMIKANRTVLMVSHSMNLIKNYCNEVVWIENGEIIEKGNPTEVIEKYINYQRKSC